MRENTHLRNRKIRAESTQATEQTRLLSQPLPIDKGMALQCLIATAPCPDFKETCN